MCPSHRFERVLYNGYSVKKLVFRGVLQMEDPVVPASDAAPGDGSAPAADPTSTPAGDIPTPGDDGIANDSTPGNPDEKPNDTENPSLYTVSARPDKPDEASDNSASFDVPGGHSVGFWGNLFNLMNVILGAGILGVPSTLSGPGIIVSIIVSIVVVAANYCCTVYVLILEKRTESDGFEHMAEKILGRWGLYSLATGDLVFNLCAMLGYLIIGTDFILSWLRLGGIDWGSRWERAPVVLVYAFVLPIALSIPKSLKFLSYVSMAESVCIGFFILATLIKFGQQDGDLVADSVRIARVNETLFSSIAVFAFSFALPVCIGPVIGEYHVSVEKKCQSCLISLIITLVITLFPSLFSYLQFGDAATGNIIESYPDNDGVFITVRVCFFIVETCSFAAFTHCVSGSFGALIYGINNPNDLIGWKRAIVLAISCAIPLVVAMFLSDVRPALEVGGAIGGCLGNFVLPALMWVVFSDHPKTHWSNILAYVVMVFGAVSGVAATYYAILSAIDAFSKG
jgi:amino acid permease